MRVTVLLLFQSKVSGNTEQLEQLKMEIQAKWDNWDFRVLNILEVVFPIFVIVYFIVMALLASASGHKNGWKTLLDYRFLLVPILALFGPISK